MATWNEFETDAPDIAEAGKKLLYQFGVGLAFLATLRKDGAPRLHPICPTVVDGHLYALIGPTPKRADLRRGGRNCGTGVRSARAIAQEFATLGSRDSRVPSAVACRLRAAARRKHPYRADCSKSRRARRSVRAARSCRRSPIHARLDSWDCARRRQLD